MMKFIFIAVCALTWCNSLYSQNSLNPSTGLVYFEFASLDFNKYAELHETVKTDGHFAVETVCIPAKVICVRVLDQRSSAEAFKQLCTLSGLNATEWQAGQQAGAFDNRCQQARTGN